MADERYEQAKALVTAYEEHRRFLMDCAIRFVRERDAARKEVENARADAQNWKIHAGVLSERLAKLEGDETTSELYSALRACCAGNTDDDEPVRCQSYEASEQAAPCPRGCCVMAEKEDVHATLAAIESEEKP